MTDTIIKNLLARRAREQEIEAKRLASFDVDLLSTLAGFIDNRSDKDAPNFTEEGYAAFLAARRENNLGRVCSRGKTEKIESNNFYLMQFLPHNPEAWISAARVMQKLASNQAEQVLKHYIKFCDKSNFDHAVYLAMMANHGHVVPLLDAGPIDVAICLVFREEVPKLEQEKKQLEEKIISMEKDITQRVSSEIVKEIDSFGRPASLEEPWNIIKNAQAVEPEATVKLLETYLQSYSSAIKSEYDNSLNETQIMLGEFKGVAANVGRKARTLFGKQKEETHEIPEGLKALAGRMLEWAMGDVETGIDMLSLLLRRKKPFIVGDEVAIISANGEYVGRYFWGETTIKVPLRTQGTVSKISKEDGELCIELRLNNRQLTAKGLWNVHPDEIAFADTATVLFQQAAKEIRIRKKAEAEHLDIDALYEENNIQPGRLKELRQILPDLVYKKCNEGSSGDILEFVRKQLERDMKQRYNLTDSNWDYFIGNKSQVLLKGLEKKRMKEIKEDLPDRRDRLSNISGTLERCANYIKQFEA